jgi:hypothetical protein
MVTEKFDYERTDLPGGRLRLSDIRRTMSVHKDLIVSHYGLDAALEFLALYLDGELRIQSGDLSSAEIRGWAVHLAYTADVKLVGSRTIEVPANTEFYFFKPGIAQPGDSDYRRDPAQLAKTTFDQLRRETFDLVANIDSTSSTNTTLAGRHNGLI